MGVPGTSLCKMINKSWKQFLAVDVEKADMEAFRKHERTGRPLGDASFIDRMELLLKRRLRPKKPGPKKEG